MQQWREEDLEYFIFRDVKCNIDCNRRTMSFLCDEFSSITPCEPVDQPSSELREFAQELVVPWAPIFSLVRVRGIISDFFLPASRAKPMCCSACSTPIETQILHRSLRLVKK
jgi:hypothetical protein